MFDKTTKFDVKIYDIAHYYSVKLKDLMEKANIKRYYMAGGCFQKIVHDIDLFPVNPNDFDGINHDLKDYIVFSSVNAITVKYNDLVIQFCRYYHNSLKELVDSFDFAHCQIGAKIDNETQVVEHYFSDAYLDWKLTDEDTYTGTQYPLSSLIRSYKYKETFLEKNYKKVAVKILIDIIKRGFLNYKDFKDQLDAIDLAYVEDNDELMGLFELLRKDK